MASVARKPADVNHCSQLQNRNNLLLGIIQTQFNARLSHGNADAVSNHVTSLRWENLTVVIVN